MGQESICQVRYNGRVANGKALLETRELLFRGELRLVIPFEAISGLEAVDGALQVRFPEGEAIFELGSQAEKWAAKIRNPRGLLDKLGVKPGSRVSVLKVADAGFLDQLRGRLGAFSLEALEPDSDLIFLGAERLEELEKLHDLEPFLKRNGAVWVITPKGRQGIRDVDVMAVGKAAGLVDNKVAAFSETHTAARFVIPVARR